MRSRIGFDFGYRPFVTVLVPCRNEELVIEGLIETLLAFDYPADRHELIVIDDGSDDATGEIVDRIGRQHPRLRCLHRAPNSGGGKSGALNEALTVSRGEVVVVFDADHRRAPTSSAGSSATSPIPTWARCRAAASCATRASRSSRGRSRSTTTPGTSSTSTDGSRSTTSLPTAARTARCDGRGSTRSEAGTSRR